jgi:hypothetical protein
MDGRLGMHPFKDTEPNYRPLPSLYLDFLTFSDRTHFGRQCALLENSDNDGKMCYVTPFLEEASNSIQPRRADKVNLRI